MAAAVPWTVRVRERALEAKDRINLELTELDVAARLLARPMHVADVTGARSNAQFARRFVDEAANGLDFAAATAAAAELLALRGAADDPTAPLPSVDHIPAAHLPKERAALRLLREARVNAEAACDNVGWCSERLLTAYNLLDHPGLPGADGLIEAERAAAHGYLVVAKDLAEVSAAKVHDAVLFL